MTKHEDPSQITTQDSQKNIKEGKVAANEHKVTALKKI